ncbi:uncharacterized protein F4812DRAFT_465159 [Daldinia caldariorum]|uniref:uncharacterized protein n=1 Tax=Daldinia caldariorum TaxID=326644 RepID=UPI002007AFD1|nr:uncharacterized protein F4812DRAFT_465159 [Daldinia caldariorum]KAI1467006.1 hypothetical protein F4812DRAFT_465159 [Daldinia caldariorum]
MTVDKEQNVATGEGPEKKPGFFVKTAQHCRDWFSSVIGTYPSESQQPATYQGQQNGAMDAQAMRYTSRGYKTQDPEAAYSHNSDMKFLNRMCPFIAITIILTGILFVVVGWAITAQYSKTTHQSGNVRREVTGYGDYPDITVTPFVPSVGDMSTTVTDFLTTTTTSHVIVPVTVAGSPTVSSSVGVNTTQSVNSTTLSATSTIDIPTGITNVSVTPTGVQSEYSYPDKSTSTDNARRPTTWFFGNGTTSTQQPGTGYGSGLLTAASVSDVTITVIPIPVMTTGGTAAVNISGSTPCSRSSFSSDFQNTTTTRPTVYQTVTETWTSDNCTRSASKTSSVPTATSSSVTTTAGTDAMFSSTQAVATPVSQSATNSSEITSSSEIFTSTETETVTPVITVPGTTSITDTEVGTVTVTVSLESTVTQTLSLTSPAGTCGIKESETTTVVVYSTVYASPISTSTLSSSVTFTSTVSSATESSTSSAVPYTNESARELTTISTISSTSTSTVFMNTTRTVSIGWNTTSTYGAEAVGTSSSSTSATCTHTVLVTASPNSTVSHSTTGMETTSRSTTTYSSSSSVSVAEVPKTTFSSSTSTTTSDDSNFVVSTLISTMVTTYSLHSHTTSNVSALSSFPTATVTFHPFSVNSTGNNTSAPNTSKPENIPLGPAAPDGVVPQNFTFSISTPDQPATTSPAMQQSSGTKSKVLFAGFHRDQENTFDPFTCVVMLSTVVAIMLSI